MTTTEGETFIDRRRSRLRELIAGYGGDPENAQKYLDVWMAGRLRQVEIELMVAQDHGATSPELSVQFDLKDPRVTINAAKRKVQALGRGDLLDALYGGA